MSVVGTRFKKPRYMEYQDIAVTPQQNNTDNGYGSAIDGTFEKKCGMRVLWTKFYGEDYHPFYDETYEICFEREQAVYIIGQTINLRYQKLYENPAL
ncbi:hypothetical protein ALC53_08716 [Atta colombica]|uniref:Uncharacterized protein n=1 Tax=Atta colombica TaxID=520822 RepID=A0A151I2S8_9HYME|nr:hypothetical protein ALC53_08716 [Atta colombica]